VPASLGQAVARRMDMIKKGRTVNEQNILLERTLSELDWDGIGIPTVLANVFWIFLLLGLSSTEIMRHVREDALAEDGTEACRRLLTMIFDVARRSGRLELLRRPRVRELDEVLKRLDALIVDD
jgi:hypothetical protein